MNTCIVIGIMVFRSVSVLPFSGTYILYYTFVREYIDTLYTIECKNN